MKTLFCLLLFCFLKVTQGFEEFSKIKHGYRNKYFNISLCSIPSIHVCLMRCMEIKESCASIDFSQSLKICRAVDRYTTLMEDKQFLTMQKVAVNGNFTEWSTWSTCTKTCGGGTQFRNRTCTNPPPSDSGKDCKGDSSEVRSCSTDNCPVNGNYTQWTPWVSCSEGCEDWMQYRTRACTNPTPNYDGEDCEGKSSEFRTCEIDLCPETNLALEGSATQSSTLGSAEASFAIDGKYTMDSDEGFTETNHEWNPWLKIKLKTQAKIFKIRVINRNSDTFGRLYPFDVVIEQNRVTVSCRYEANGAEDAINGEQKIIDVLCDFLPTTGDSIKIQLTGKTTHLHVQEVEIFGFYT